MRRGVNYSNVMSSLALLVALGGTSYAAVKVTGRDVVNSSLTGADIRNRSLTPKDFRGSVQGPAGATNVVVREATYTLPGDNADHEYSVFCLRGERATGGGQAFNPSPDGDLSLQGLRSRPAAPKGIPTGWVTVGRGGGGSNVTVYVICAVP